MPAPIYSKDAYQAALLALMPRGRVWSKDQSTTQAQLQRAFAGVFQRSNGDASGLLVDAFPTTAVGLLPEWEAALGLPDPCAGPQPTIQARQAQVAARIASIGGQSPQHYIDYAASLGYAITITQFSPSRFGRSFGLPFGGIDWAYAWQVNAPTFTIQRFRFGEDAFGEPLSTWGGTVLQCELTSVSPAHTTILFNYS